ncbi:probable E3 ubiquitin-protein ligase MARCHF10 isoform X2 [Perognathus longimembris pacificus]|uniref:probable E3 ubiquitin-protein ligase MARCHF10 isoform X2 n=1 Tax=Perognathus longimembris pacificus TaxID=214514 RepID=UPI002018FDB1|nr:probable E3 ubiquitin-protein ligase MARCHF10 isoform X2 [Perognathus longimembris pacificus]
MLHEARDRQKFVSDVQYLRDMQHKVDSEYQACLRRHEFKKDPSEKKRDQFGGQDTSERTWYSSGSSSKQTVSEEDSVTEPRYTRLSSAKCDARLPAIDQASVSVKQKHKSTMTLKKPEKAGPSKPSPGDSSEHPLFCVEYTPFCSVFAFSPVLQPNTNYCCLLLPLVPPSPPVAQGPSLPPVIFPSVPKPTSTPSTTPGPLKGSPAALCYFPVSCPTPSETPVLCLPGPRRPSKIYFMW